MTTVDVAGLRATAEAATPGPWAAASNASRTRLHPKDMEFVAAFDPPTCLGLLDELDRLRAELARVANDNCGCVSVSS